MPFFHHTWSATKIVDFVGRAVSAVARQTVFSRSSTYLRAILFILNKGMYGNSSKKQQWSWLIKYRFVQCAVVECDVMCTLPQKVLGKSRPLQREYYYVHQGATVAFRDAIMLRDVCGDELLLGVHLQVAFLLVSCAIHTSFVQTKV